MAFSGFNAARMTVRLAFLKGQYRVYKAARVPDPKKKKKTRFARTSRKKAAFRLLPHTFGRSVARNT